MPSPAPRLSHQRILGQLHVILYTHVVQSNLGWVFFAPTDVKIREDTVYQPDLFVVLREHADRLRETHLEGAPDLVIEVLLPSTAQLDLWVKRHDYERAGVQEYWVVDPDTRTVEQYVREGDRLVCVTRVEGEGVLSSRLLPDLAVEVGQLFAESDAQG